MSSVLRVDARARGDIVTLLGRASRFDAAVRLTANGELLVVTVPITVSSGLLDLGPTILGMRVTRMLEPAVFDAAVPSEALLEALTAGADPEVPTAGIVPAWASVTPPRSGWRLIDDLTVDAVREGAAHAAARVEHELPTNPGDAVVRRVRRAVWSEPSPAGSISLGLCVALDALGFLRGDTVRVTQAQGWTRASTVAGDALQR